MKRFFYIAILSVLYLTACSGPSQNEHEHTHEDGSTHADHEDHEQEEFSVTDSTSHEQMHEAGEEHDH